MISDLLTTESAVIQTESAQTQDILIVDDDADIRQFFHRATAIFGSKIHLSACKNLASARTLINERNIVLAFIDKELADGDGVDFSLQLAKTPTCAVYVVTGEGNSADVMRALEGGVKDYIPKPLHLSDVRDTIRRHVLVNEADRPEGEIMGETRRSLIQSRFHLVGESAAMIRVAGAVQRTAKTDATTLVIGDSGTGKEVVAKQIHELSSRQHKKFVAVNCAAIPMNLIEAELFGHEKGAFTDARAQRAGLFEEAQGGTIFLDEITSTSLDFQVKLLRVLQEQKIRRVGANEEIDLDVRVIAASNKNMEDEIRAGNFREDLYFRLKGTEILLPRLVARDKDITVLARHFGDRVARREKKQVYFSAGVIQALNQYCWPGNVRELESVIEYAISRCNGTVLLSDLPDSLREAVGEKNKPSRVFSVRKVEELRSLSEIVDLYAMHALDVCDGNKSLAAERLVCERKFFYSAQDRIARGETDPFLYSRIGVGRGQKKNGNAQEELPLK